jgi:Phosphotransferase enzyme family
MTFSLSSLNVREYLAKQGFCIDNTHNLLIESKSSKNFNLLVTLENNQRLLIKQESQNSEGKTSGEFYQEWYFHELIKKFPELKEIRGLVSEAIIFDTENSIIIFNYHDDYKDLEEADIQKGIYYLDIASSIGVVIATIHKKTIDKQNYRLFLASKLANVDKQPNFVRGLKRVRTGIFSQVISENIKLFKLYQRANDLQKAIEKLTSEYQQRCLIHNDLKFGNILLVNNWQEITQGNINYPQESLIRLIDWEKFGWGDPAHDLGKLIASYLNLWLDSIVISQEIDIETALSIATIPLEKVQPVIGKIATSYLSNFPEILYLYSNFWQRVVQFTGMALIEKLHTKIHYHEPIGNVGICMLQVAQSLLCYPEISLKVIFVEDVVELTSPEIISA